MIDQTVSAAEASGLEVGRMLPGMPGRRIDAVFQVRDHAPPAAVAVTDGATISILLQAAAAQIGDDRDATMTFCSDVLAYVGTRLMAQKIIVVGPDGNRALAQRLVVELVRDYPRISQWFCLCEAPIANPYMVMTPAERRLLAPVERMALRPPVAQPPASQMARRVTGTSEAGGPIGAIGPELRDALQGVHSSVDPIPAYGRIADLVTPLPQPRPSWRRMLDGLLGRGQRQMPRTSPGLS